MISEKHKANDILIKIYIITNTHIKKKANDQPSFVYSLHCYDHLPIFYFLFLIYRVSSSFWPFRLLNTELNCINLN